MSRITVRDLLMFGRYPYHQGRPSETDKTIVEEALAEFHLQGFADRYLTELSGGQRQRAMIAMVFCQRTDYVLLDEPLNNLRHVSCPLPHANPAPADRPNTNAPPSSSCTTSTRQQPTPITSSP